jgi:hypothetical protein
LALLWLGLAIIGQLARSASVFCTAQLQRSAGLRRIRFVSGSNAHLFDEALQFAQREMPDFDYIGLHGIGLISDENRFSSSTSSVKLKVGVCSTSATTPARLGNIRPMSR